MPRVPKPLEVTPAAFERHFARHAKPVVIEGLSADWPARAWCFPDAVDWLPDRVIACSGAAAADGMSVRTYQLAPTDVAVGLAGEAPDWFFDLRSELPELAPSVPVPAVHRGVMRYSILFGRDTQTRGHFPATEHAMICQVHGRKRVILYGPGDSARLYPYPRDVRPDHSRVDFASPDRAAFPRAAKARGFETILEPGDALFIPVRWWHAVYGLGAVMSTSLLWPARMREYPLGSARLRAMAAAVRRRLIAARRARK